MFVPLSEERLAKLLALVAGLPALSCHWAVEGLWSFGFWPYAEIIHFKRADINHPKENISNAKIEICFIQYLIFTLFFFNL